MENNCNVFEHSIRTFGEYDAKFPGFVNNNDNVLTNTDSIQNNLDEMIVTQDSMVIEHNNVIYTEQC